MGDRCGRWWFLVTQRTGIKDWVVNYWLRRPKSVVLSSMFGLEGPKVLYCRQFLVSAAPKCCTVVNFWPHDPFNAYQRCLFAALSQQMRDSSHLGELDRTNKDVVQIASFFISVVGKDAIEDARKTASGRPRASPMRKRCMTKQDNPRYSIAPRIPLDQGCCLVVSLLVLVSNP